MKEQIDILSQIVQEDTYSRKNICWKVREELVNSFPSKIEQCKQLVIDYLLDSHSYLGKEGEIKYTEKKVFCGEVLGLFKTDVNPDDYIIEVLMACCDTDKQSFQAVVGRIKNLLQFDKELTKVKVSADIISVLSKSDLFNIVTHIDGTLHVESMIEFSDKLQNFIQKTMYIPPFITKPKHIMNNSDCGFYTIKQHCILKKHNQHDLPIPLDVLNIQNSIELCIDISGLEYDEEFEWKKKHELLNEKQKIDLKENFEKQKQQSWDIYYDVIERENLFYLAHSFDARLRLYPLGYHLNYMSCKYKRSLVNIKQEYTIPITRSFQLVEEEEPIQIVSTFNVVSNLIEIVNNREVISFRTRSDARIYAKQNNSIVQDSKLYETVLNNRWFVFV